MRKLKGTLLTFVIIFSILTVIQIPYVKAEESTGPSIIDTFTYDWPKFWQTFKTYSTWQTEWYNGESWVNHDSCMQIIRDYPTPNHVKITLNFTSLDAGNYRFTFAIDKRVKEYVEKISNWQYELTYEDFSVVFDWSDMKEIPGLIVAHGVQDGYFWFRIRRDNVPADYNLVIDPSIIMTYSFFGPVGHGSQHSTFYAQTLHWVFYTDDADDYLKYKTSTDKETWSSATNLITVVGLSGVDFSVWNNSTHVHYVVAVELYQNSVYYRCGQLSPDGTISWITDNQVVDSAPSGYGYWIPSITADSDGYPFIGYTISHSTAGLRKGAITKSSLNNGTWVTDGGFPYNVSSKNSGVTLVPLTSGKVYAVYGIYSLPVNGSLWNGTDWETEEIVSDYNLKSCELFSAVAIGDDVHVVYKRRDISQFRYIEREYGSGWQTESLVTNVTTVYSSPYFSITGNSLAVFWTCTTNNAVYYSKKSSTADWQTAVTWLNETEHQIDSAMRGGSFYQADGGGIGFVYQTGTGSYYLKYAFLDIPPEWAPLEYTGYEPVFQCAMNNMFELNGILEGNNTYRQMLLDTSPYENHGKIYPLTHPYAGPELTWGRMGKALEFDGVDDSVIVSNATSLNITEAITIEFWFSIYDDEATKQVFISKADNSSYGEWIIGIDNGTLYTELWTTTGDKYSNYTGNSLTSSIEKDVFYFFSLTYDYHDGYYTVWLHGEPQYNVTTNGWYIRDTDVNLYLGSLSNSSLWFNGVLDEVRIFPYVRTYSEFHSDMRTPISRFGSWSFVNSGLSDDGDTWTVIEGVTEGYQGFKNNDPELPWAYANATHNVTFVRTLKYMAGFQSYQLYCNLKFDTNDDRYNIWGANNSITWYWNFFKDGRLQVTYELYINVNEWDSDHVTTWYIRFRRTTPYFETEVRATNYFQPNSTLFPNEVPLIVSAWVGPDNKHFTMRVDFQDERVAVSSWKPFPFIWTFDLVDEDLNPHIIDWFDGWIVTGIKARAGTVDSLDYWYKMEIESHKFFIIAAIIITTVIVSAYTIYILTGAEEGPIGQIIKEVSTILQPITEVVGAAVKAMGDIVVDALAGLSHDIIAALSSLGNTVNQAMAPVYDTLSTWFGALIITLTDALGPAMFDAWLTFVGFLDTIGASVGVPGLFTNMINWIISLWDWVLISMTNLFSFLTSMFLIWVEVGTKATSTFAQVITQWILIIQGVIYFLDTGYGYGVGLWDQLGGTTWLILAAILYPLWLLAMWEEEGFDVLLSHINFVINILAMLVRGFITIVSFFIRIVSTLIESIPIVE